MESTTQSGLHPQHLMPAHLQWKTILVYTHIQSDCECRLGLHVFVYIGFLSVWSMEGLSSGLASSSDAPQALVQTSSSTNLQLGIGPWKA